MFVLCVALPTHVGARSMAVLLGQPFEYYYYYYYVAVLAEGNTLCMNKKCDRKFIYGMTGKSG